MGMSVSAADVQQRFDTTNGTDPIFRPVDGSNCDHTIDVLTKAGRSAAYRLLRTRGLIRIAIGIPGSGKLKAVSSSNNATLKSWMSIIRTIAVKRTLSRCTEAAADRQPSVFELTVMFDGRESSPATGTTKIIYGNYPTSLLADLAHQSVDATNGHAQGARTLTNPIPELVPAIGHREF